MNARPSFFIVGAPKAGTTALFAWLGRHPQVCMSTVKEPNYFTCREIAGQNLYYAECNICTMDEYLSLFDPGPNVRAVGEASVSYLFYPETAARISCFEQKAKIIISLREPVSRAFSHFQMDQRLGLVGENFELIWRNGPSHPRTGNHYQQYFLLSDYFEQVCRYLEVFPRQQVLILAQEQLLREPENVAQRLCSFLDIDPIPDRPISEQENSGGLGRNAMVRFLYRTPAIRKTAAGVVRGRLRRKIKDAALDKSATPPLDPGFVMELRSYYRPRLVRLRDLTGLPIDHWIV